MIRLPASALLDPRWNTALDLAASLPVPPSAAETAATWEAIGPEGVLVTLRALARLAGALDEEAAS